MGVEDVIYIVAALAMAAFAISKGILQAMFSALRNLIPARFGGTRGEGGEGGEEAGEAGEAAEAGEAGEAGELGELAELALL